MCSFNSNSLLRSHFENCTLLTECEQESLAKWTQVPSWRKIYNANADGFSEADFHKHCDGVSPTITVMKGGDNIYVGYTTAPWDSTKGTWVEDKEAFVYSATTGRIVVTKPHQAVYIGSSYPWWGVLGIQRPKGHTEPKLYCSKNSFYSGWDHLTSNAQLSEFEVYSPQSMIDM